MPTATTYDNIANTLHVTCLKKSLEQLSQCATFVKRSAERQGYTEEMELMAKISREVAAREITKASMLQEAAKTVIECSRKCGCEIWLVGKISPLTEIVEDVRNITSVNPPSNGKLIHFTNEITLSHGEITPVNIGVLKISLSPTDMNLVVSSTDPTKVSHDGFCHPNVNRDGIPCLGNLKSSVEMCLLSGKVSDAFFLITQCLNTYNHFDKYRSLEQWRGIPCSECNAPFHRQNVVNCANCDRHLCGNCRCRCTRCRRNYCHSCHTASTVAANCGCTCCSSCIVSCRRCLTTMCEHHGRFCQECASHYCRNHVTSCFQCGGFICNEHAYIMDDGNPYCSQCTFICEVCNERHRSALLTDCRREEESENSNHMICSNCGVSCVDCNQMVCTCSVCTVCKCGLCRGCRNDYGMCLQCAKRNRLHEQK